MRAVGARPKGDLKCSRACWQAQLFSAGAALIASAAGIQAATAAMKLSQAECDTLWNQANPSKGATLRCRKPSRMSAISRVSTSTTTARFRRLSLERLQQRPRKEFQFVRKQLRNERFFQQVQQILRPGVAAKATRRLSLPDVMSSDRRQSWSARPLRSSRAKFRPGHQDPQDPPVTGRICPVTPAAAGEARNTTAAAMSSRLVHRLRSFGFIAAMCGPRIDQPRRNRVDADTDVASFERKRACEGFHTRLGAVVSNHIRLRAARTRGVPDRSAAGLGHVGEDCARREERTEQIVVDLGAPILQAVLNRRFTSASVPPRD